MKKFLAIFFLLLNLLLAAIVAAKIENFSFLAFYGIFLGGTLFITAIFFGGKSQSK